MPLSVVLDTNTYLSAIIWETSVPAQVLSYALEHCILLHSQETFLELQQVLERPKFNRYLRQEYRTEALTLIERSAQFRRVSSVVKVCRDSRDDKFLALVQDTDADYLITGDVDLLVLESFKTCRILTGRDFLRNVLS